MADAIISYGWDKVLKNVTDSHHYFAFYPWAVNKKWWDGLSKSDQMTIEAAASMENDVMMAEFNWKNGTALKKLVTEQGVQLREFNDDIYDAFGEAAAEVFAETRKHSKLAARIYDSFDNARKEVGGWMKVSDQAYLNQRNRVLGL